jgi:hypothetical protein
MASEYGYLTVSDLESHMAMDFETSDSALTDDVIEARISAAERIVNSVAGETYGASPPDAIVAAATVVSERLVVALWNNRHPESKIEPEGDLWDGTLERLLDGEDAVYSSVDTSSG